MVRERHNSRPPRLRSGRSSRGQGVFGRDKWRPAPTLPTGNTERDLLGDTTTGGFHVACLTGSGTTKPS